MDLELVTEETSDDENYGLDDYSEDSLNYEGERCGICMDVVIDRGVLDCCQHWFCFACIDNWATITSLCPLCQNEFQLITCVPVYDTVGGNKTDDKTNPRDDDWFIEEKSNTLSFPSYYIDEKAVVCLDGDDCKIRSGSVAIEEDSDIDISIACDSCDKWYHAFCVGFDPEGSCDSSWLCPRCTVVKDPERSDMVPVLRESYQNDLEIIAGDYPAEASFSGRVSVADDGETAILISLVESNQDSQESIVGCSKIMENTLPNSTSNMPNSEALPCYKNSLDPNSCKQETRTFLPRDNGYTSSHDELKIGADDAMGRASKHLNNKMIDTVNMKDNDLAQDREVGSLEAKNRSEDLLTAEKMGCDEMEVLSTKSLLPDGDETVDRTTGAKRKHEDSRNADIEAKFSQKEIKAERDSLPICWTDQTAVSSLDDSKINYSQSNVRGSTNKCKSEKKIGTSDIMDIVQEKDRRSLKHQNSSDRRPKESESATGLRVKKIMRRAGDNKDSLELVQELRTKIREAVRNKSSIELGQEHFDPKLLNAFRAALAGSGPEDRKPTVDMRAKRSLLQKGKVRESLTKKIYGTGGKRKRAWTRECEVEFWKHRCLKTTKSEKIQTLKSVLDALRDNSDCVENEQGTKGSILTRLYLADNSVFPRNNDIQPVSVVKAIQIHDQKKHDGLTEKGSAVQPNNHSDQNPQKHNIVPQMESKEMIKITKGVKSGTASNDAQQKQHPKGALKIENRPDTIKGDKRKWALELLARKTAVSGKNIQEKQEDNVILKGNYALLAQLPKDMRPVLAPSCHNKIATSVRQSQLHRLTEHFLKKANIPVVSRTAEMELAVADAVNIEKQIADRSNNKLVYLNLCSQELLRRSDVNSNRVKESNACSSSDCISFGPSEEINNSSFDLVVDEALRKVGLLSDSPPNSPNHPIEDIKNRVGSPEDTDEEGHDNVIEVDSLPDLDIYGDFEYSLEDDDFIGAGALNISKMELEVPKMKLLFSSLKSEKTNGILNSPDSEVHGNVESFASASDLPESQDKTCTGGPPVDCVVHVDLVPNSSELSLAEECEELYGPEREPLIVKYPKSAFGKTVSNELESATDDSKQWPSDPEKRVNVVKREKTSKGDTKQIECHSNTVMNKVEAYIKEHLRPLCKSGVIAVEQYRWAVKKTTEKVMKYHSKEKNANFLIKEGEKVKKLAEQYVEAAQKTKT